MKNKVKKKARPVVKAKAKSKVAQAKKKTVSKSKPAKKPKPVAKAKPKAKAKPVVKKKTVIKSKPIAKAKADKRKIAPPVISKKELKKIQQQKEEEKKSIPAVSTNKPTERKPSVGKSLPYNKIEPSRQIIPKTEEIPGKNRYSDKELEEFRDIIIKKLEEARKELTTLQAQLTAANDHGTDDTASTFKMLEDGSDSLAKEEAGQLASRQKKFIEQLENAMVRIENKTYGICRVTGKLIPKERLRAVPHTTQSIEAKLNQYRD